MVAALDLPEPMLLDAFLVWDAPEGSMWQLVDGEPRAMAPASPIHGAIQSRLGLLIGNHLDARDSGCLPLVKLG